MSNAAGSLRIGNQSWAPGGSSHRGNSMGVACAGHPPDLASAAAISKRVHLDRLPCNKSSTPALRHLP